MDHRFQVKELRQFRSTGGWSVQCHRSLADVTPGRTAAPLGGGSRKPAHPIGKSRSNLAGSDSPRLDVGRTCAWLDQYQDHSWRDLLRTHHPHRHRVPDVR